MKWYRKTAPDICDLSVQLSFNICDLLSGPDHCDLFRHTKSEGIAHELTSASTIYTSWHSLNYSFWE